jgi:hypothetical protein
MVNCIVCVLFVVQAIILITSSSPLVSYILLQRQGKPVPDELYEQVSIDGFIDQRRRVSHYFFVSMICTLLVVLTALMRVFIENETTEQAE